MENRGEKLTLTIIGLVTGKKACLNIPQIDVGSVGGVDDTQHSVHRHGTDGLAVLTHYLGGEARVHRLDQRVPVY